MTSDLGRHTLRRTRDARALLTGRDDLDYETSQWWTVSVDDETPDLDLVTQARVALSRPAWSIETRGRIEISGGDVFDTTVELVVLENGTEVFSRRWHEAIPREWV